MKYTYKLYNNKITLTFDDNRHTYEVDDKIVYGVTSITGVIDKSGPLMWWAVNQSIEYLKNNLEPGKELDEIQIDTLLKEAKGAHRRKKQKAASVGDLSHTWLDNYFTAKVKKTELPKPPVNKEARNVVKTVLEWGKQNKVVPIDSERVIYSKKHKYAGTFDLLAKVNGKRTVIDFKTSKAIYPEMLLQASAYLNAIEEEFGKKVDGGVTILRLPKKGSDFETRSMGREKVDNLIKVFLACHRIYAWKQDIKTTALNKKYGNK